MICVPILSILYAFGYVNRALSAAQGEGLCVRFPQIFCRSNYLAVAGLAAENREWGLDPRRSPTTEIAA